MSAKVALLLLPALPDGGVSPCWLCCGCLPVIFPR
ncbi:hypothetical protein QFZ48_001490 [Chitinophaga sp. W2I13]